MMKIKLANDFYQMIRGKTTQLNFINLVQVDINTESRKGSFPPTF